MPSDAKQEFLSAVRARIRFRPARGQIERELSAHIDDLAAQKQANGMEKGEAAAVAEMGDPAEVGASLNKVHRPRAEWSLVVLAALLILLGLWLQSMLSRTSPEVFGKFGYVLLYTLGGIAVLAAALFFGSALLRRLPWLCFSLLFVLLSSLLIMSSANRLVRLNAYYVVLLLVPVYAAVLERLRTLKGWGVVLACALCGLVVIVLLIFPNALAVLIWGICCAVLLTIAIARGQFGVKKGRALLLVYGAAVFCVAALLAVLVNGRQYRFDRLRWLFTASFDPNGTTYFLYQLRQLVAASQPIDQTMPVDSWASIVNQSDFTLSYVLYSFGKIPVAFVLLLFGAFFARLFAALRKLRDESARLQSLAVLLSLGVQTVFYSLFNLGLLLPMGATLPFLSFGALSCCVNMALLGLLLSHYRIKDIRQAETISLNHR